MGQRSPLLTFALCTSLTVHLLGLSALAWWYVAHTPPPKLAAIDREKLMIDAMNAPRSKPPPPPPPATKKKLPRPKFDPPQPSAMPKDDSGEALGKGTANRSTPGERPMQATKGYEQADLMRDAPDPLLLDPSSPEPAAAGAVVGGNGSKQSLAMTGHYTPDFVAESQAIADPNADAPKPISTRKGVGPLKLPVAEKQNVPIPSGEKKAAPKPAANARQTEVAKALKGRRAISSDADSVAFANANSTTFHDGRMEGRQGLRVSPKRVVFGDASTHDAEVMGGFRLVIGAWVDADGNVTDAVILQSSGSPNIDLDYQRSIYDWTFEPPKDKAGHPTATQWAITCE
jgi:TonB family protein